MTRVGRRVRAAVFLRSFAVQGSWNYRTLIGTGFAFALAPALRALYPGDPARMRDALKRHAGLFNCHPYLAPMALGAVASLEADDEDPDVVERFKSAVRGSLGSLGDRLVWAGWRPVCALFAAALVLLGTPWWVGVVAFLGFYNAGHLFLRSWSYRVGFREGKAIGERLRQSPVARAQRVLAVVGAFLVGLVLPLGAAGGYFRPAALLEESLLPAPWIALAAAGGILGARIGAAARVPVILGLGAIAVFGLIAAVLR